MEYTIKLQDIVGPKKLPGFNGVGEIDLVKYVNTKVDIPQGYSFSSLGSLDLVEEVDELEDIWSNDGVREEGNADDRIDSLQNSFSVNGYKIKEPGMGSKDSNGKELPVEGRGRAIAAKRNREKQMPWVNLIKDEPGELARISAGVLANLKHDPATKATREDVITAGLKLIGDGELNPNPVDINSWLKDRLEIQKVFVQRNITLIVDGIMKRYREGENAVRIKERAAWIEVLKKDFKIEVDNKTTFLFSMDSDTYSCRAFCEAVLEHGLKTSVDIICYTKRKLPSEARKKLKKFMTDLDKYTRLTYKVVGSRRDTEFKNVDPSKHYKIKGCIPQFIVDHVDEWDSKVLINVDDY
tara:strand:+ start:119 stop:1180 length:1062 start_codon:yes stop_codon:yes gene_type:complete